MGQKFQFRRKLDGKLGFLIKKARFVERSHIHIQEEEEELKSKLKDFYLHFFYLTSMSLYQTISFLISNRTF